MEQKNQHHHPSHCDTDSSCSFTVFQPWNTEGLDVKKKRRLLIDQLSLPTSKLPCWGPSSISIPHGADNFKFDKKLQEEEEGEESTPTEIAIEGKETSKEQVQMQGEKDKLQRSYGHEEDLLEFGSHGHNCIYEQCCSDSAQSLLLLPTNSKHDFVLSSGRWSVDPEAESKTIKPTIDQEFEQYFSVFLPSLDP
ncbi:protein FAR-RED ELONGATED HYPOCOTYL 1-like [Benincasa hispida]|uniref:protein FAR-RED ELONGATED HYPOCOTYL 1-like n=1 Tax=Benincasa hispida TaxID=102211 RepID=UPI0019010E7E|nr:protein FAR-RED ELONGATED HYPOCOTYL 1-like [Benincasa hispida]